MFWRAAEVWKERKSISQHILITRIFPLGQSAGGIFLSFF